MKSTKQQQTSISSVTFSVTIVLLLLGFSLILFFHAQRISQEIRQHMDIVVELDQNLDSKAINELMIQLKEKEGVQSESVEWIKASEGFDYMKEEYLSGINIVENPLSDIISFNVEALFYSEARLEQLKESVLSWDGTTAFYYQNEQTETVNAVLNKVVFGVLSLSVLFCVVSVLLIVNALKLRLYADKSEIKTMQVVGAKNSFIKKPYLHRSLGIALRGTLYASLIILCLCIIGALKFSWLAAIISWGIILFVLLSLFVFSISLLLWISNTQLNRYLSQEMHDLL
jgi:cell division transport system permease protein